MWVWNGPSARRGPGVPRAYVALAVFGVSLAVCLVEVSRVLPLGLPANAAEDQRRIAADAGVQVTSGSLPTQSASRKVSTNPPANSAAGRTPGLPTAEATTMQSAEDARNTEKLARKPDADVSVENKLTLRTGQRREQPGLEPEDFLLKTRQSHRESPRTSHFTPSPQHHDSASQKPVLPHRGTLDTPDAGETSVITARLTQLPHGVHGSPEDTATLPGSAGKTAGEQKLQKVHEAHLESPEAEILKGRSRFNTLNSCATSLTDKFAEKVATLTAQVDLLRMNVVRARNEVQRLNDSFDARTEETLREIEERSTQFGADLSRLEKELEGLLNPDTGVVSKRIGELRQELLKLRGRARKMFEKEATVFVQQIESCSARVDSLTEVYFDLKSRTDLEVNEIESYMVSSRRKLEDTMQEQLNILTETEREAAARASQRFKSFLKSLRLEGNVLQSVVKSIQRRFLEPQATFANSGESSTRRATYIDMSGLFANSKVEKVCVVVTQLIKELLEGNTVVPVFIYTVSPKETCSRPPLPGALTGSAAPGAKRSGGKPSLFSHTITFDSDVLNGGANMQNGAQHLGTKKKQNERRDARAGNHSPGLDASADPAVEMVLPNVEILEKAASLWLRERREYGLSYDHYAVVRIEGYLMEYFTVPFLEYHPYFYASEDGFATVNAEQFATSLKSSLEEKLSSLEAGLQKQTYLLVAYVGEVASDEDVVRPPPSLLQTSSRMRLARQLTQNIKPRSPSMYFIFQYFQQMLHFTDQAEELFKQGIKKRNAVQARLSGDDIRVLVVTDNCRDGTADCTTWGGMTTRPRDDDPFFRGAFAVLRLTLKQVAPDFLVFPSDYLVAVALDLLIWEVTGGSRIPGLLSLSRVSPDSTQGSVNGDRKKGKEERHQGPGPGGRHTTGVLISTGGKAARGWSAATLTASLSLLEQRRRRGHGTPADSLGLMKKDGASDEVVAIHILKNSTQHAVRVSFSSTLEEVAKHTLNVTLRVMREKLDYLARGYTLYVCVYLV